MQIVALVSVCLCSIAYLGIAQRFETAKETSSNFRNSLASLLFATNPAASLPRVKPARVDARTNMVSTLGARTSTPIEDWPGVTEPMGFFDPVGFSKDVSEGKQRFYREVELKHGRIAMLAALGILVAENFPVLFDGEVDAPAVYAFQQTLQMEFRKEPSFIYGLILFLIAIPEVFSVYTFNNPAGGEPWSIREDHEAGDLGFDPLGLKPTDPAELKEMQTKELNNGRLAMLGAAGMLAQEFVFPDKIIDHLVERPFEFPAELSNVYYL